MSEPSREHLARLAPGVLVVVIDANGWAQSGRVVEWPELHADGWRVKVDIGAGLAHHCATPHVARVGTVFK